MSVRLKADNSEVYAYLIGDIDHHTAKEMREEIDHYIERNRPKELTLDFREVSFMDSSGIGLVMGRYRLMQELDGEIAVCNVSPHIRRVMRLAGLDRLAKINGGKKDECVK